MLANQHLPTYTYKDYSSWKGDWELIGGIPYSMSPSPKRGHQYAGIALSAQIFQQLKDCEECFVFYEHDWIIDESTVLCPDIYITCSPTTSDYQNTAPILIVEILSPSTTTKDRLLKHQIYEQQGVLYYLIVDPVKKWVEIHLLKGDRYEKIAETSDGHFDFELKDCKVSLDFKGIWM